jgi:hypothetical protein
MKHQLVDRFLKDVGKAMKAAKAEEPYPKKGARRADGTIAKEFDLVTESWIRNMWYHPDTKATTATKVDDAGAVMADGKPATLAQIAALTRKTCDEFSTGAGNSAMYWPSAGLSKGKYGKGSDWKGPAVIVGGGGGDDWRTRDIILPPEVLPQATLIAAAGQRHNLGDAGWQESAFAPMVAELKKWSAV